MKDASMSLGIYLEIKDAEICGGDGSIGWAATIVDIYSSDRPGIISRTVQDFKRKMAQYFHVPLRNIKQISRGEYEAYADRDYHTYEHEGRQETMIIQLEIPKEFAKDYANNRFDDFFRRVYADIDNEGMCGNYEGETAQMMARAFKESRCLDYEKTR